MTLSKKYFSCMCVHIAYILCTSPYSVHNKPISLCNKNTLTQGKFDDKYNNKHKCLLQSNLHDTDTKLQDSRSQTTELKR